MKNTLSLSKIFSHGANCAFLPTFAEAISVAERLRDPCRVVWLWVGPDADSSRYRVTRVPEIAQQDREDKTGSYIRLVWDSGVVIVPEDQHGIKRRTIPPPEPPPPELKREPASPVPEQKQRPRRNESASAVSIPVLIEALKHAEIPAEKILEIIAECTS